MKIVTMYQCDICGELFYNEQECFEHENRHTIHNLVNKMWDDGKSIGEIQEITHFWKYLYDGTFDKIKNITKDNCFIISYWQCCNKPAYRICEFSFDGSASVWGCGSWTGYYGNDVSLNEYYLHSPYPKEELFVDPRYNGGRY